MNKPPEQSRSDALPDASGAGEEVSRADPAANGPAAHRPAESGDWSRRRFGKAALVATPILASLYGRPLMAQHNCTPSGWVSGNTSAHHEDQLCGGKTPGYWQSDNSKGQVSGWAATHLELLNDSLLGFGFLGTVLAIRDDGSTEEATLDDAVQGPGEVPFAGVDELTRQLIRSATAALLNARYLLDYALREQRVRDILEETLLTGEYVTGTGDTLTAEQVKDFFQSTMDLA